MILDSNILIYSIVEQHEKLLAPYVKEPANAISLITRLEVLGFHRLTVEDKEQFEKVFSRLHVIDMSEALVEKAIGLRQQKSLSVGDAIIAATALEYGLTLVTRNTDDFKWIAGLQLVNPFS